ncbi:Succinate dehydrogenase subunitB, mitochondrial [Sesamum angolense]|uniref:Succinate dehydrogenase subunitB, mitochondrial n=1 Tax=Sesamum angolense TaxID=2727404 RepID=A0AAE1WZA7_9LAMI|nr:Succinate dehydrogenase subunitB, mitochondrial [Sesamum angolense]
MAFLLNKTTLSALRLHSQKSNDALTISRRGFHVEPGAREKATEDVQEYEKKDSSKTQDLHNPENSPTTTVAQDQFPLDLCRVKYNKRILASWHLFPYCFWFIFHSAAFGPFLLSLQNFAFFRVPFKPISVFQLLAEDPSLKRFKSHKKSLRRLKTVGDVLTIVVVADAIYFGYNLRRCKIKPEMFSR